MFQQKGVLFNLRLLLYSSKEMSTEFREHNDESKLTSTILINQSKRLTARHKNNPLPDPWMTGINQGSVEIDLFKYIVKYRIYSLLDIIYNHVLIEYIKINYDLL